MANQQTKGNKFQKTAERLVYKFQAVGEHSAPYLIHYLLTQRKKSVTVTRSLQNLGPSSPCLMSKEYYLQIH
jgi:hypothetical protein